MDNGGVVFDTCCDESQVKWCRRLCCLDCLNMHKEDATALWKSKNRVFATENVPNDLVSNVPITTQGDTYVCSRIYLREINIVPVMRARK